MRRGSRSQEAHDELDDDDLPTERNTELGARQRAPEPSFRARHCRAHLVGASLQQL